MGTWSTTAPTNLATSWTDLGTTAQVNSGFYKVGTYPDQISYNFWSQIYIARNKKDQLVVRIDLYSLYGKSYNIETGQVSDSNVANQVYTYFTCTDTSTSTDPSIYHKFGSGEKVGTYYYTLSDRGPASITCGVYTSVNTSKRSVLTITTIPSHACALLWANINNEWKEAQIFSSNGTSWNEGVIFNTTHLPS